MTTKGPWLDPLQYAARDQAFLQEFLDRWDEPFASGEAIDGGDLTEWVAEWLTRIRRAEDTYCLYCGVLCDSTFIPNLEDEEGWAAMAIKHTATCVWIKTRGNQRPYPLTESI